MNIWTDNIFKKGKTTVKPHEKPSTLIVSGPFRLSRHPMYLGMAAILFGVSILLGSLTLFIFPIIFGILMQ
ncbi:MAG: methyltransferase, partial [Patescibacteria group bacterium]|nr:methyltransferase [Patescibacteria group bacterium]